MNVESEINISKLVQDIKDLISGINNWEKPLKKSMQILRTEQRQNFDKQGAIYQGGGFVRAGGAFSNSGKATTSRGAWKPLAKSTKAQRKKLGYGPSRPILVRSGKLKEGFRITKLTKEEGIIDNTVPYAKYHQQDEPGRGKLPQRRIMGFSNKSKAAIRLEFLKYLQGHLKRFK